MARVCSVAIIQVTSRRSCQARRGRWSGTGSHGVTVHRIMIPWIIRVRATFVQTDPFCQKTEDEVHRASCDQGLTRTGPLTQCSELKLS